MTDNGGAIMIALSNPVSASRESEFNTWYDEVHARQLLGIDGIRSVRRYRACEQLLPPASVPGEAAYRYLAIYEVDDAAAAIAAIRAATPGLDMSDVLGEDALGIAFEMIFSAGDAT